MFIPIVFFFFRKREREAEIAVEEEVKAKKEWQKQWDVSSFPLVKRRFAPFTYYVMTCFDLCWHVLVFIRCCFSLFSLLS